MQLRNLQKIEPKLVQVSREEVFRWTTSRGDSRRAQHEVSDLLTPDFSHVLGSARLVLVEAATFVAEEEAGKRALGHLKELLVLGRSSFSTPL